MNLSGYSSDNVPNGGQRILSVWPWEAGMRHQPAGEGLHHFAEALIRGHTFREKGVEHQQELLSKVVYGVIMRRRDPGVLHLRI